MVPTTGRESDAKGVWFKDEERIRWTRPGAWRSIRGDRAWDQGQKINDLDAEDSQSRVVHLWGHVPHAETCATCGNDEVDWVGGITDPRDDRVTDELRVIRDYGGVWDKISTAPQEVGCGEAGGVQEIIGKRSIAHGEHGCGEHGDPGGVWRCWGVTR